MVFLRSILLAVLSVIIFYLLFIAACVIGQWDYLFALLSGIAFSGLVYINKKKKLTIVLITVFAWLILIISILSNNISFILDKFIPGRGVPGREIEEWAKFSSIILVFFISFLIHVLSFWFFLISYIAIKRDKKKYVRRLLNIVRIAAVTFTAIECLDFMTPAVIIHAPQTYNVRVGYVYGNFTLGDDAYILKMVELDRRQVYSYICAGAKRKFSCRLIGNDHALYISWGTVKGDFKEYKVLNHKIAYPINKADPVYHDGGIFLSRIGGDQRRYHVYIGDDGTEKIE